MSNCHGILWRMVGGNRDKSQYDEFEASELFCPTCRQARPVRKHLLLILPQGNQYDYRCAVCATSVGSKTDDDTSGFDILRHR